MKKGSGYKTATVTKRRNYKMATVTKRRNYKTATAITRRIHKTANLTNWRLQQNSDFFKSYFFAMFNSWFGRDYRLFCMKLQKMEDFLFIV